MVRVVCHRPGAAVRASTCRYRPGPPVGGVGGGKVTLVFQVLGELDHRGVELGEMLIPAERHRVARLAADLQRAEHGGDHRDDRGEPPAAHREPQPRRAARCPGLGGQVGVAERTATVLSDGALYVDGIRYSSPSGASRAASGTSENGWPFGSSTPRASDSSTTFGESTSTQRDVDVEDDDSPDDED